MRAGSERSRLRMIWIRACYRLFFNHPLLLFMLLFLIYLRISFPYMFFFLISASPVIICTAVLLCALVAFGHKHAQGTENDALNGHKFSSSRPNSTSQADFTPPTMKGGGGGGSGGSSVDDSGGGGGSFRDKFAELRKDIVEKEMKESRFIDGRNNDHHQHHHHKMKGSIGNNVDHLMFVYNDKFPKAEFKKQLNGEHEQRFEVQNKERVGVSVNGHQKRATTFAELRRKVKEDDYMDHCSSSSPSSSSIASVDSDVPPISSKEASTREYMAKICDYHPLMDPEDHQGLHGESPMAIVEQAMKLKGIYGAIHEEVFEDDEISSIAQEDHEAILGHSSSDKEHKQQLEKLIGETSHNYDINVNGDEEEVEHKEVDDEEDEDDEEAHEVKEGCIESMVNWTEEDEKNLKDLSSLELERNRQLEKIIERRRSQKNLSDQPFQVAHISIAKTNPFNSPESHQPEMHPVPGSAPAFFPRRNPFDEFHDYKPNLNHHRTTPRHGPTSSTDRRHEKSSQARFDRDPSLLNRHVSSDLRHNNDEQEECRTPSDGEASGREALFRRYRSFGVVGASFYGFLWDGNEEPASPTEPHFVPEQDDHSDSADGQDSFEYKQNQGSESETSSSPRAAMEDQEEAGHSESASETSSEINMDENKQEVDDTRKETGNGSAASSSSSSAFSSSSGSKEKAKSSNVGDDDATKVEDHANQAQEDASHEEPVYESYDTSPTGANNVILSSDSSHLEEKPDG